MKEPGESRSEELVLSFPGIVEWHQTPYSRLHINAENLESRVLGLFQSQYSWSAYQTLHVALMLKGEPWGYGGVFSDPIIQVKDLDNGTRLKELVSRAVTLASNQVDAPFRAQRMDYIKDMTARAPDFGGDFTAEASYSRRMHRVAAERFSVGNVAPCPDEVRLIFAV